MLNFERLSKDLDYISSITSTENEGCTRFSYSKEDNEARKYIISELEKLNLNVTVDAIGNIRSKYNPNNTNEKSIMFGSHIDTVKNGGKFDGLLGTISSLEIIRTIIENNIEIHKPLEFVIFAEEEGSNFGTTMLGSKAMAGKIEKEYLKTIYNDQGVTAYDFLEEKGYNPENLSSCKITEDEIEYMLEFHVEQGGILDSENIPIGIVENIAGMYTLKISFKGVSNHAGSTPMYLRKDPMLGAADLILFLNDLVSNNSNESSVGTIGKIISIPNGSNVIAEKVEIYVDLRDVISLELDRLKGIVEKEVVNIADKYGIDYEIELVGKSSPSNLSDHIRDTIEEVTKEEGFAYKKMNSGAVHDSVMLTDLAEVGMIFVPSIGGLSHCPNEDTDFEDIKKGVEVFYKTVLRLSEANK